MDKTDSCPLKLQTEQHWQELGWDELLLLHQVLQQIPPVAAQLLLDCSMTIRKEKSSLKTFNEVPVSLFMKEEPPHWSVG